MLMQSPQFTPNNSIHPGMKKLMSMQHQQQQQQQQQQYQKQQQALQPQLHLKQIPSPQQHHHIDKLLNTAAAGAGVVGDVDALLTPVMQITSNALRPERNLWRVEEILEMLSIMLSLNAIELLNDKTIKSEIVFRNIEKIMQKRGYRKKSHAQIWTKWKFLKSTYTTSKRNGTVPKMIPAEVHELLHKMLNGTTSDCGNSTASLDGDNNSSNGGRMVISNVEGGYSNGNKRQRDGDTEDDNGFGMAHPIFGFRLGLVKQEPTDAGYETITNSGATCDQDPLEENNLTTSHCSVENLYPFEETEIKKEIDDEQSSSPLHLFVEQQRKPTAMQSHKKYSINTAPTPAATSTPNAVQNHNLPPLRLAHFAKTTTDNAITPNRTMPPLSLPLGSRPATRMCNTSGGSIQFMQPKLVPKSLVPPQSSGTSIRFTKDITVQPRAFATASTLPTTRLKQLPLRKTQYSLRPDRMIPDLSTPPPPPAYNAYNDGPTTSQQALKDHMTTMVIPSRRRRLDIPWCNTNQPSVKMPRISSHPLLLPEDIAKVQQEQHFKTATQTEQKKPSRKDQDSFHKSLKDLGASLRQMQHDMLKNFFDSQMELARKEHQFQLKQDLLIMQAFEKQSQHIMKTASDLLNVDFSALEQSKLSKTNAAKIYRLKTKTTKRVNTQMLESQLAAKKVLAKTSQAAAIESDENHNAEDNEDEENANEHENDDEHLVYEDGEYLQDNNDQASVENEHEPESESETDEDEVAAHYENDDDNDDDDDDDNDVNGVTDPIQLVSSELVEDN